MGACVLERLLILSMVAGVWAADDLNIRLPASIVPQHYRIKMISVLQEGDFRLVGSLRMDFVAKESTDQVVLHAVNLTVVEDSVNVVTLSRGDPRALSFEELLSIAEEESGDSRFDAEPIRSQSVTYDTEKEFVIIRLTTALLENRHYRLNFNYRGKLSDGLKGFYRSHYIDRATNSKRWLAVTQMEPTAARQVFPCLDEPSLKATFEIVIGRSGNTTSLSNMPLSRTEPMRNKEGWFWDYFDKSVPMSTYLVACLISDFQFRQARPVRRQIGADSGDAATASTAVRVWAQRDMVDQTELALKVTTPMLEFLERYFQVAFPLPKIDLVALPDFSAGAMENWGLITFRETALLVDPKSPAVREEMNVERIIAHELAHQWFGNLVTMKWWNDLWLNEGFATYVQRIVLDAVSPKYEYGTLQSLDFLNILNTDALESSHPISVQVKHPNQIKEIFDGVSYTKGSAVIRMMNHFLGEATFRQALTNYLTDKKYRNAEQDDLWQFMSQQAHADDALPSSVDVKTIMDTWTLQMGFPVVSVTRNYSTGSVSFDQRRFLRTTGTYAIKSLPLDDEVEGRQSEESEPSYLWWVPVSYTDAAEKNFDTNNTLPRLWLSPDQVTATQDSGPEEDAWIVANIQGTGYFRVNYDDRNWQLLSDQLLSDHQVIHVLNRAHLISDAFALAAINSVPYTTPFNLIRYLDKEDHHVPWQSGLNALGYVGRMFLHTAHYGRYQAFVSSLVFPSYLRIGAEFKPDDQPMTKMLRISLTAEACAHGHRPCIHRSQDLFEEWMNSPDPVSFNAIPADLRSTTYCTAIKYGGAQEWDFGFQMASRVTSSQHRDTLLSALGCSREPWILVRYLSMSLDAESGIRKQDGRRVVGAVAANPVGRSIAFHFLRKHFDQLLPYFTIQRAMQMLSAVTSSFNTAEELQTVEEFLATKADQLKTVQATTKQIVTAIAANVDWMARNSATLVQWFESKGF